MCVGVHYLDVLWAVLNPSVHLQLFLKLGSSSPCPSIFVSFKEIFPFKYQTAREIIIKILIKRVTSYILKSSVA